MEDILKISLIAYMFYALGEEGMIFHWYRNLICTLPEWLCRPLGGCYLCLTGQVCFWFYLIKHFQSYSLIGHLFFISAGIFLSSVYNQIFQK
jgi:hypothetical protein